MIALRRIYRTGETENFTEEELPSCFVAVVAEQVTGVEEEEEEDDDEGGGERSLNPRIKERD